MTNMEMRNGLWVPANANVVNHTHLDCVLRHLDVVVKATEVGFDKFEEPFPELTVRLAKAADLLHQAGGREYRELARKLRRRAAAAYREECYSRADDLTLYVAAIAKQLVPLMQTRENLQLFTQHYIDDLIADHTIGAVIRFAPHLHIFGKLTLDEVVEAVAEVTAKAPIPIKLMLCVLRGPDTPENRKVAREVRELCVKYSKYVGAMDLAGAEKLFPGVLDWYFEEALRAREESNGRVAVTMHIGEVVKVPQGEVERLKENGVTSVGHFLWNDDPDLYQECCPHSNLTLKAHPTLTRYGDHSIDRKLREGQRVMLSTDGTTLIRTSMRRQIDQGRRSFGWGDSELYRLGVNAVMGGCYDESDKARMVKQLKLAYNQ